ncbi:MAG: sensor histidine kinase, partial [Candidatus Sericytochromatia bacterium]
GAPAWAEADALRVGQVVTNLVGNAIKFTPRGGRLAVALRPEAGAWRVEVQDSGIGIDDAHLSKLFQRFYQVDSSSTRERGGVGLGLSIAQSIVEAHDGTIGVESRPGEGSTFWFTLPAAAPPEPEAPGLAASRDEA